MTRRHNPVLYNKNLKIARGKTKGRLDKINTGCLLPKTQKTKHQDLT